MKAYKTTLKEVFSDDPNSPFWQRLRASPGYAKFEEDLAHIMEESIKHGMPYDSIPKDPNNDTTQ
jgi:hypothetical protein